MSGIFLSLSRIENELFHRNLFVSNASKHLVGLYTTRLPVFRWRARGYDWILVDSIGQPSGCDSARLAVQEMLQEIVTAVMSRPVNSIALSLRFLETLLVFHCHSAEGSFEPIIVSSTCTPWPNGGGLDTCFPVFPTRTLCSILFSIVLNRCP